MASNTIRFGKSIVAGFAILAGGFSARAETPSQSDGIELAAVYTADVWANVSGGQKRGVRYLDNLDLLVDVDGEALLDLPRVQFHAHALYNNGQTFSDLVGDTQVVSNIEAGAQTVILYEAWADAPLGKDGSIRFGLYDLNSEFDANEIGSLFINSSHGIGADIALSGENGPSIFPVTSLAARVQYAIGPGLIARAAILDAVPGNPQRPGRTAVRLSSREGALLIGELEHQSDRNKLVAGSWTYTEDQSRLDERGASRSRGGYILLERNLGTVGEAGADLDAFLRAGVADQQTNPVAAYFGGGVTVAQPFNLESEHMLGLAIAWAEFGQSYRRLGFTGQREVNLELTYIQRIHEKVTVQPDLQLIFSPSGDPTLDHAVAAGMRVVIEL